MSSKPGSVQDHLKQLMRQFQATPSEELPPTTGNKKSDEPPTLRQLQKVHSLGGWVSAI
jgi:hypothetical protein